MWPVPTLGARRRQAPPRSARQRGAACSCPPAAIPIWYSEQSRWVAHGWIRAGVNGTTVAMAPMSGFAGQPLYPQAPVLWRSVQAGFPPSGAQTGPERHHRPRDVCDYQSSGHSSCSQAPLSLRWASSTADRIAQHVAQCSPLCESSVIVVSRLRCRGQGVLGAAAQLSSTRRGSSPGGAEVEVGSTRGDWVGAGSTGVSGPSCVFVRPAAVSSPGRRPPR